MPSAPTKSASKLRAKRSPFRLAPTLREHGYADDPERFRELLMHLFAEYYRDWSLDDFLCDELEPRVFVRAVRTAIRAPKLPHKLVLLTLLAMRKRG